MHDIERAWARKILLENVIASVMAEEVTCDAHVRAYKARMSSILTRRLAARCSEEEAAWEIDHPEEWSF